jgi:RNA polymerase sigma-70 factor, ECF subfamily
MSESGSVSASVQARAFADDDARPAIRRSVTELLPSLRAFARSLTRDMTEADDLVQETMVRALANLHQFTPGTNLKAWLFTILRNTHISTSKRRSRERGLMSAVAPEDVGRAPAQEWFTAKDAVQQALAKLPDAQRETIILIGALGLSYEECAEVCACEIGTVKSRLNRARARLAVLLEAETVDDVV